MTRYLLIEWNSTQWVPFNTMRSEALFHSEEEALNYAYRWENPNSGRRGPRPAAWTLPTTFDIILVELPEPPLDKTCSESRPRGPDSV